MIYKLILYNNILLQQPHDYEYLLNNSHKNCEDINFQQCGILDTYGNIMCIPKEEKCPINKIIIDFLIKLKIIFLKDIIQFVMEIYQKIMLYIIQTIKQINEYMLT